MQHGAKLNFVEEIAALVAPTSSDNQRMPIVSVWHDFARGLEQAEIGAAVRRLDERNRYALVLWPAYRPAWRTQMLTFAIRPPSVVIYQKDAEELSSVPELQNWLRDFASEPRFKQTLQSLRDEAKEPVEARLIIEGDRDLLVEVSAQHQQQLATTTTVETEISVQLEKGDTIPSLKAIRALRSAGIDRDVIDAQSSGRTLRVRLARCT
jgi:hypothetical protein